jgi:hypothetical protein
MLSDNQTCGRPVASARALAEQSDFLAKIDRCGLVALIVDLHGELPCLTGGVEVARGLVSITDMHQRLGFLMPVAYLSR